MSKLLRFIFLCFISISYAQNEANIWYFGEHAGIDFNSGSPVALLNGALNTFEGCATISDTSGNLLFYTDGSTVYNKNHAIMPNGTGLLGNSSSTQSAIIVPRHDNSDIYYIFTVAAWAETDGLNYSEVDMSLEGGLGDITSNKNIQLYTPVAEKLTAVTHANGEDIWVITHIIDPVNNHFYAYLVSDTGVSTIPIISSTGVVIEYMSAGSSAIGAIKVSPDGTKLAIATTTLGTQLCDFNATTGVVSNAIDLRTGSFDYGVEFSPSNEFLYVSNSNSLTTLAEIYQFNLLASDIPASEVVIHQENTDLLGQLQLGPDGKIYVADHLSQYLDVIENPNNLGLACNYTEDALYLDGKLSRVGLPPFIQSFFHVGFQTQNVCEGDATQFNANISQSYDSLVWDFGDGNTSNVENPIHTYTTAGTYNVSVTVISGGNTTDTSQQITIYEQPTVTQPQNILICDINNDGFHDFNLRDQDAAILNGQSTSVFDVTYYATMADYNVNNPITNPSNYINSTAYTSQSIIASVQNIQSRTCEVMTSFDIQVFESPTPSQNIPALSFCDNTTIGTDSDGRIEFDLTQNEITILNGQSATDFTVKYYTDSGLTNQITSPSIYQNTNPTETIYVEVVNNNNFNCTAQTSFEIEVYELPTVTPIVTLRQCDDDLDGFSIFNLTEVNAELSANHQNETITFYEIQTDAESGNNPITNNTAYTNQTVSTDMVWARIENSNNCYRTAQVNLIISTTQIPNTFTRDFFQCDDGADMTDGIATFDFSTVNAEIQALFPVGQQLIINYYRNQADALSETNPIADISNYQNIGYPNQQDLFIRVDSALDNDCLGLGAHITLNVEIVPVAHSVTIAEQCDDDGDGMYAFNISTIETTLLNGQTNVTIEYFDALGNPLPSPMPNPFLTASQVITARVINATSQDPDGACFDETQITFTVEAAAVANAVPDFIECDDDNDGQFAFNTSNVEATVLNGQTGMIVNYTDEYGNSLPSPLPNPFSTATQDITVRVENPLSVTCFDETTISFIVYEQPIANAVQNDFVCDDVSNNGEFFTLSNYDVEVLNGQSATTFEVFYFESDLDAQNNNSPLPNLYQVTTTSQPIFARIQNQYNPDCFDVTSFEIGVYYLPIAHQPEDISVCDDTSNDGKELFDLSQQNIAILNGQSATENSITYHLSQQGADDGSNPLNENFINTQNPQTIYVRLENNDNSDCYTTALFQLIVNEQPVLLMKDQWPICDDETVEIIADAGYDEYLWSTGAITQTIIVDTAGTYGVTATNVYGNLRCEASKNITVTESNIATITNIETIDWTQNDNTIIVFVEGYGDYEYSLDGISYQDSNEFHNLTVDEYSVYVRDKNGCGVAAESIYLLYYPRFFTPNGDGYNDTWQLVNSEKEPNNKIYIFDRYGKLLKQLSPTDIGWDGTYNSTRLSSNDYWFVLERQNRKTYRGHFTLKR